MATSVRVTATITALGIATQSSQLVITTGLPDQDSVSLAVSCNNVEAFDIDGTEVDVTVRLSDRYNNPVPDGTAVTFNTEGGNVLSSCSTITTASQSGLCTVTWYQFQPASCQRPEHDHCHGDRRGELCRHQRQWHLR